MNEYITGILIWKGKGLYVCSFLVCLLFTCDCFVRWFVRLFLCVFGSIFVSFLLRFFSGFKSCVFTHDDNNHDPVGILAAWYPPPNSTISAQHEGSTSTKVEKWMGGTGYLFNWIDLVHYSPCDKGEIPNRIVTTLQIMLTSENDTACHFVASYGARINAAICHEVAKGYVPVVLWAGQESNTARHWLCAAGLIREDDSHAAQDMYGEQTPWCQV
jgi:hypothetical protein